MPEPVQQSSVSHPWHCLPAADVLTALDSDEQGLTGDAARLRLARHGRNELPQPGRTPLLLVFLRQFASPLIYLLLAASVVSVAIGAYSDAVFIFAVLVINAAIGTVQEWKAEQSARALEQYVERRVVVHRDGIDTEVAATELVPGDIVRLEAGVHVSADLRLLSAAELQVDESLLTGESTPVSKIAGAVLPAATALADRANMLYAGTILLGGQARGVVTGTGAGTEIGSIASALGVESSPPPPLLQRLARFSRVVALAMLAAILLLGGIEFLRGVAPVDIFFLCVALAVAAIPEGLPVAVTVALAIASARMAARNVVVRMLPAVEGLGSCTIIASDKTGTLTMNALTVRRVLLADLSEHEVSGEGYGTVGTVGGTEGLPDGARGEALRALVRCALLCNEASYAVRDEDVTHFGDTVDVALQAFGAKLGLWRDDLLGDCPELELRPFDPEHRHAAAIHAVQGRPQAFVKGAVEAVLPMCGGAAVDRPAVLAAVERLAAAGYRVIALAAGPVEKPAGSAHYALQGLQFLGLTALIDPVRPEVPEAIARCRDAGIDVCMVTGDHPATALAIARELKLAYAPAEVMIGSEFATLDDGYDPVAHGKRVFARFGPAQKTALVHRLQQAGHVVAVTGDGVNDAPALHEADIGMAMGKGGTDVARGTADLILTDDNFASIVNGIEEGRVAYANVRKVVYLLIATGAGEIVLFLLAIASGLPIPLFPAQLLWLNLVSNGIQDVALAFERAEGDVLHRPPRSPRERVFDRRMIEQVVLSGGFIGLAAFAVFFGCLQFGLSEFDARNILLLLMVSFENVHVFNARSETVSAFRVPFRSNPFLILAVLGAQGLHVGAMHLPGLRDVLQVAPIDVRNWFVVVASALSLLVVMELYKWLRPLPGDQGRI